MKIRSPLLCFFLGIVVSTLFATIGIHGMDEQSKQEAYEHGFAVYTFNAHTKAVSWFWLDDYLTQELKKYYPPQTPQPKLQSL